MEDMDIGLLRPAIIPLEIMEFIIVVMMVEVDIGIKRTYTLPIVIVEFVIVVIKVVKVVDVDICLKILATLPCAILYKHLMLTVEVNIGLRPATISHITQLDVVDCWFYQFLLLLLIKIFS